MINLCELPQVPEVKTAVSKVIDSQRFVKGPLVTEFEKQWAEKSGKKYAVGVSSGATALELVIQYIFARDKAVSYSEYTYQAVPNAIRRMGKIPFIEDSPMIYAHHLHDMPPTYIPRLEDCSHCHGYKPVAKTAIFSLFPTKILGACGDAGVIVTDSEQLYDALLLLRSHEEIYSKPDVLTGEMKILAGTNGRMDEIQAAVLLAKLPHLEEWIARRKEIVDMYDVAFDMKTLGNYHYMYCIDGTQETVDKLISLGIGSKLVYEAPYVALPLYPEMTNKQVKEVIKCVNSL